MRFIPSIRSLLFALVVLALSAASFAQVGISVTIAPPALPVYEQPPLPAQGYIWTPGYWAYSEGDYYSVPGTWVMAPQVGFLWTPGYWGWGNGMYVFNEGYWGPHVGFYGGINYGYGYTGEGYQGGRWDHGQFAYNRAVNNVNVTNIHNTYNTTVINNTTVNRVSYNGGNGGLTARPNSQQEAAAHERHIAPVAVQTQHAQAARANPQQRVSVNQGKPAIAATPKPGAFDDRAAVPAKEAGAPNKPAVKSAAAEPTAKPSPAQPANNVPRPGTAQGNAPAAHNDVPRPPNASKPTGTPRENTTRPESARGNHASA
jgi:WXXGXW repeat (2 copies)